MNCKECGYLIPSNLTREDSFECPNCGHRYRRRAPSQQAQAQRVRQQPQEQPQETRTKSPKAKSNSIMPFRTARIVIGIVSAVLFVIVMLQSCTTNVVNTLAENSTDASAGGGTVVAFALLIAGITTAIGRDKVKATLVAGIIYILSAIIGFISLGTFGDLIIWSSAALIFGALDVFCWFKGKNA